MRDCAPGVDDSAVEGVDDPLVGLAVGPAVAHERREELEREPAVVGPEQRDVGVGLEAVEGVAETTEPGAELGDLAVHPAGHQAVREHAAPVGLGAVGQRVPVPVLDHGRAARDEGERRLLELAGVGGEVELGPADGLRVGLGDEEARLLRRVEPVGLPHERGDAGGRPRRDGLEVEAGVEVVLHRVVGVAGGEVERAHELLIVERGPRVGDARGHELAVMGVLAHDARPARR